MDGVMHCYECSLVNENHASVGSVITVLPPSAKSTSMRSMTQSRKFTRLCEG